MEKLLTKKNIIIFVGLLTLWRIFLNATLALHPDEAYYWLWSRFPALSYYDHPPMVAYFIKLTTLFSLGEFWVRFSGIAVSLVLSVLAWLLSKQFFDNREDLAAASVFALNVYPVTMTGSIIITPDAPAFLFWGFCVYLYWQVFRAGRPVYWYLSGLSLGLGLLSKYTVVLLVPLVILFMLLTEERKWFKTVHPYLSGLLALIVFAPVLLWNLGHEWISFKFQLGHGLGGQAWKFSNLIEYTGGQLLVASPFVWLAGIPVLVVFLFKKKKEYLYISLTSLPIIIFFGYASLKKTSEANWPALAYFSFTFAFTWLLYSGSKLKKILWSLSVIFCVILSLLATVHARFGVIPLERFSKDLAKTDATNWFYGYRELGEEIKKYSGTSFVVTPSHQLSAEIIYYTGSAFPAGIDEKITRFSQFNYWNNLKDMEGKDGLYIYADGDATGPYETYFGSMGGESRIEISRKNFPIRTYHIVKAKALKPGFVK